MHSMFCVLVYLVSEAPKAMLVKDGKCLLHVQVSCPKCCTSFRCVRVGSGSVLKMFKRIGRSLEVTKRLQ